MKNLKKHIKKIYVILLLIPVILVGIFVIAFTLFRVDGSDTALLTAKDTIDIPDYRSPQWFKGQGLPLKMSLLKEGYSTLPDGSTMYILPHVLTDLPYKNLEETKQWVDFVNNNYHPNPIWTVNTDPRMGNYRCMAQSASTVVDWFTLLLGDTLGTYKNTFTGRQEQGFDYRIIDDIYYQRSITDKNSYYFVPQDLHPDPIAHTPVPISVYGYANIISESSLNPNEKMTVKDYDLPLSFTYSPKDFHMYGNPITLFRNKAFWQILLGIEPKESQKVVDALHQHGIILAGIKARFSALNGNLRNTELGFVPLAFFSGHGVSIVGYIQKDGHTYFIYRETFGKSDKELADVGVSYRLFPVYGFNEMYAFSEPLKFATQKLNQNTYQLSVTNAEAKPVDLVVGKELTSNSAAIITQISKGDYKIVTDVPTTLTVAKDFFYQDNGKPYTITLQ